MKALLGQQLKKTPVLYRLAAGIYFTLQPTHIKELLVGTSAREKEWATRHLKRGNDWNSSRHTGDRDEWVVGYWDSREHSHRRSLVEKVSAYYPFSTVLEIGCNSGPNLYLLAKKFPGADLRGIDINPRAVDKGNELFQVEGISGVKLSAGKADDLVQFADKAFDITFTDAVLIYIGRDKIKTVMDEMLRVTRRALIFVEQHCFESERDPQGLGFYRDGLWERDYVALLRQYVPEKHITVSKITKEMWADKRWSQSGAIIEAVLGQLP